MSSEAVPMTLTQTAYKPLVGAYVEYEPKGGSGLILSGAVLNTKFVGLSFTAAPFRQQFSRPFPVASPPFNSLVFSAYLYSSSAVSTFTVGGRLIVDEDFSQFSETSPPNSFTTRLVAVSPSSLALSAGVPALVTFTPSASDLAALKLITDLEKWRGTIGLEITAVLGDSPEVVVKNDIFFTTAVATREVDDVRGRSGMGEFGVPDRVRQCPRCGGPRLETEMVEDGFRRGLLVCAECWDPPDQRHNPIRGIRRGAY